MTNFGTFELYDSLSVNINNDGEKGYLWIIKDKDSNGILLAYKSEKEMLALLEENKTILKEDINIGSHGLIKEDQSRFFLRSEYGQNLGSGDEIYCTFTSEGVFVDSLVMFRKIYEEDGVFVEYASITQDDLGKIRLKDLTNKIWDKYAIEFERRE